MKIIILLLLTSCATYIPVPTMPIAPAELVQPCDNLQQLKGNTLADLIELMYNNAYIYKICRINHQGLIDLYNKHRSITK